MTGLVAADAVGAVTAGAIAVGRAVRPRSLAASVRRVQLDGQPDRAGGQRDGAAVAGAVDGAAAAQGFEVEAQLIAGLGRRGDVLEPQLPAADRVGDGERL